MTKIKQSKLSEYKPAFKFLGIFFGVIAVYYLIIMFSGNNFFDPYINFSAWLSSKFLSIFYTDIISNGSLIGSSKFVVVLSFGCEGTEPLVIFLAGVIAFPIILKYKIIGLIIGFIFIYFLNILRIMLLFFIGNISPSTFEMFHSEIFPILFIILALIVWLYWIKYSQNQIKKDFSSLATKQ
ncbi:MAG: archaeosortase/exosortase family protein [Candidatus Kapabacteria bacterium]|nr:archaeosortase/exosortase family protein [Candidatus Kapabacteria bacterium]